MRFERPVQGHVYDLTNLDTVIDTTLSCESTPEILEVGTSPELIEVHTSPELVDLYINAPTDLIEERTQDVSELAEELIDERTDAPTDSDESVDELTDAPSQPTKENRAVSPTDVLPKVSEEIPNEITSKASSTELQRQRRSSPYDLKWLHNFEVVEADVDGEALCYEVEDFGSFYDGDDNILADIEEYLNRQRGDTLKLSAIFLKDVLHPIEYTLKHGVSDISKNELVSKLRCKKAFFMINHVIPKIYNHPNFAGIQKSIARSVTNLLKLIADLASTQPHDIENGEQTETHFKTKAFLSNVARHIWSGCLCDGGINLLDGETIPILRKLAMRDLLDENWNYVGGWENVLKLLEERHGEIHRISADKEIHAMTDLLREARNSLRCQTIEVQARTVTIDEVDDVGGPLPDKIFRYFPKCSAYLCMNVETHSKPHRLRCYQCNYYHWCSPACQEYSETIAGHHKTFCEFCPEEKSLECRDQMREHLNIPNVNDDGIVNNISCHACGITKTVAKTMCRCSQCKAVYYCSSSCQTWDWKHGKHGLKCEPP